MLDLNNAKVYECVMLESNFRAQTQSGTVAVSLGTPVIVPVMHSKLTRNEPSPDKTEIINSIQLSNFASIYFTGRKWLSTPLEEHICY